MATPNPPRIGFQTAFTMFTTLIIGLQNEIDRLRYELTVQLRDMHHEQQGLQHRAQVLQGTLENLNAQLHQQRQAHAATAKKTGALAGALFSTARFFYVGTFEKALTSLLELAPLKAGLWGLLGSSAWTGTIYATENAADKIGLEPVGEAIRGAKGAVGQFLWDNAKPAVTSAAKQATYAAAAGMGNLALATASAAAEDVKSSISDSVNGKISDILKLLGNPSMNGPLRPSQGTLADRIEKLTATSATPSTSSDLLALVMLTATAGLAYIGWSKVNQYYQAKQKQDPSTPNKNLKQVEGK